ncbi:MAG: 2-oxoacid:acceptor oxidoreductase family protein [Lachnospiraceae bacterium]|nr:2-oxoacid:acceptor oxidoreductase family protein [Lachnospiraceae bacterium]
MENNLCIAGFGGQGVMTFGKLLATAVCDNTDYNVTFFPSYGAEQRGGTANCYLIISDREIGTPMSDILDDLVVLNQPSYDKFVSKLKMGGRLFVNSSIVKPTSDRSDIQIISVPATDIVVGMGNIKVLNIFMLGVYIGYTEIVPSESIWKSIMEKMAGKPSLVELNKNAFEQGIELGRSQK